MTTKFFTSHCYKGADFFYSSKNDNMADLDSMKFIYKTQPFSDATDFGCTHSIFLGFKTKY